MKTSQVAKVYARSLFQLGQEEKVDVTRLAFEFHDLVLSSNELENVLYLDIFTALEKKTVLEAIFSKIKIDDLMKKFLLFLIDEKRFSSFPAIFQELTLMDDEQHGLIRASVTGKMPTIEEADVQKITQYLKKMIGKNPIIKYEQDENVLAGVRVYAQDLQFDATFNHQLEQFQQSLLGE